MSANDELQDHTCEKMLEFYGNVANNVANEKVQLLDHIVETTEKVVVEKEVYEAVLRNSVKVADLEAENMQLRQFCEEFNALKVSEENLQLKQKVTSRNKRLQKYKKLKGELATLASNRNILIKRLKEENNKLKELLKEWVKFYPIVLYEYEDTLKTKDIIELREKTVEVLNVGED